MSRKMVVYIVFTEAEIILQIYTCICMRVRVRVRVHVCVCVCKPRVNQTKFIKSKIRMRRHDLPRRISVFSRQNFLSNEAERICITYVYLWKFSM